MLPSALGPGMHMAQVINPSGHRLELFALEIDFLLEPHTFSFFRSFFAPSVLLFLLSG